MQSGADEDKTYRSLTADDVGEAAQTIRDADPTWAPGQAGRLPSVTAGWRGSRILCAMTPKQCSTCTWPIDFVLMLWNACVRPVVGATEFI